MITGSYNVAIGPGAADDLTWQSGCTIIGKNVPAPQADDTLRIGTGDVFLEVDRDGARIVGGSVDEAVVALLEAISDSAQAIVEHLRERVRVEGLDGRNYP